MLHPNNSVRVALIIVLPSVLGIHFILGNPSSSTILLHPELRP